MVWSACSFGHVISAYVAVNHNGLKPMPENCKRFCPLRGIEKKKGQAGKFACVCFFFFWFIAYNHGNRSTDRSPGCVCHSRPTLFPSHPPPSPLAHASAFPQDPEPDGAWWGDLQLVWRAHGDAVPRAGDDDPLLHVQLPVAAQGRRPLRKVPRPEARRYLRRRGSAVSGVSCTPSCGVARVSKPRANP